MRIKRIYHHFSKCEEYNGAMWKSSLGMDKTAMTEKAILFMSDCDIFEAHMMLVVSEWPLSCEANFTSNGINKIAWLGQAACAIGIDCPEDIVKTAWGSLTDLQRANANLAASKIVKKWVNDHLEKIYA